MLAMKSPLYVFTVLTYIVLTCQIASSSSSRKKTRSTKNDPFDSVPSHHEEFADPEENLKLSDLPLVLLTDIAGRIDNIRDLARLKAVNREWRRVVSDKAPRVPGGEPCKHIHHHFTINQTSQVATFSDTFLADYLDTILPSGTWIQDMYFTNYAQVKQDLRNVWKCINSLSQDGYKVDVFAYEDLRAFDGIAKKRSNPGEPMTDPLRMLVSHMVNEHHLNDTSLGLSLLASGVGYDVELFMQLIWTFMPTLKEVTSFYDLSAFYSQDIRSQFETVVLGYYDYHTEFQGRYFYRVNNEEELDVKTQQLLDAFKQGMKNHFQQPEIVLSGQIAKTQTLLSILSYALHSAFSADNLKFLLDATRPEFLQSLVSDVGIFQVTIDYIAESEVWPSWDGELKELLVRQMRRRGDPVDDASLIESIKEERESIEDGRIPFVRIAYHHFPRIQEYYQDLYAHHDE